MKYTARHAPHPTNRQNWAVDSETKKGIFHSTEAEAKLFAAAPELLEALTQVTESLQYVCNQEDKFKRLELNGRTVRNERIIKARAAIAKATQKSS